MNRIKQWWAARRAAKRERLRMKLRIELSGLKLEQLALEQLMKPHAEVYTSYVDQWVATVKRIGQINQHLKEIE